MRYPLIRGGVITGFTSKPNETSSTPIDEKSKEWKDYEKEQDEEKAEKEKYSDVSFNQILDELEARFPGFIASARGR